MTKRTLLIDSDIFIYRAANRAQSKFDWGEGAAIHCDEAVAMLDLTKQVLDIQETLGGDVLMALGATNNWRKEVLPDYKANRKPEDKPQLLTFLREFVTKTWDVWTRPTLEADDVLGILSTAPDIVKGEKIIVSIDKDFQSIPGLLYNPDKSERGVQKIGHDQADYYHAYQTLIGDSTDNYKGCPGIGPKKATAILGPITKAEYWPAIVKAFEDKELTEADALVQARVARICRNQDYDRQKKQVILWRPPMTAEQAAAVVHHNADGEPV